MDRETKTYIKNIAVKTVAVTLAVFVVLTALLILALPKKASDITYGMGMRKTACSLMETQYKRTDDINDLSVLFDRVVDLGDEKLMYTYGKEFLEHKYFDDYCKFKAKTPLTIADTAFKEYVEGYYAVGILSNSGVDDAVAYLESVTEEYTITSPYSFFVYYVAENYDASKSADAEKIVQSLDKIYISMLSEGNYDLKRIAADAYDICEKYDLAESAAWQERYAEE